MSWSVVDLHPFGEPSIRLDTHFIHVRHGQTVTLDTQKSERQHYVQQGRAAHQYSTDVMFLRDECSPGKTAPCNPQTEAAERAPSSQSRSLPIQPPGTVAPCLGIQPFHNTATLGHARLSCISAPGVGQAELRQAHLVCTSNAGDTMVGGGTLHTKGSPAYSNLLQGTCGMAFKVCTTLTYFRMGVCNIRKSVSRPLLIMTCI